MYVVYSREAAGGGPLGGRLRHYCFSTNADAARASQEEYALNHWSQLTGEPVKPVEAPDCPLFEPSARGPNGERLEVVAVDVDPTGLDIDDEDLPVIRIVRDSPETGSAVVACEFRIAVVGPSIADFLHMPTEQDAANERSFEH